MAERAQSLNGWGKTKGKAFERFLVEALRPPSADDLPLDKEVPFLMRVTLVELLDLASDVELRALLLTRAASVAPDPARTERIDALLFAVREIRATAKRILSRTHDEGFRSDPAV